MLTVVCPLNSVFQVSFTFKGSFGRVCNNRAEYGVLVMLVLVMLILVMLRLFLIQCLV